MLSFGLDLKINVFGKRGDQRDSLRFEYGNDTSAKNLRRVDFSS